MAQRPPTSSELDDLGARADAAPSGTWRKHEGGGLDHFALRGAAGQGDAHLYAAAEVGAAVTRLLEAARADMPRLVAEVRRLRDEVEALQTERDQRAARPAAAPAPRRPVAEAQEIDDDAALALAAPFHVGPKEMKAAASDPLAALSVQVARALLPDAKEVERARLIAMAFAASRGQMDDFWAARKMRGGKKTAVAANAKKKGPTRGTLAIVLWLAGSLWWGSCGKADDTTSRPAGGGTPAAPQATARPPSDSAESEPGATQAKDAQTGMALFLADQHHGSKTFSGETFDNRKLMAAHPSYPMGTVVRVTNLRNGRAVEVVVVDRGPSQKKGAIIDLSRAAAEQLDFIGAGGTRVRLEVVEWGGGRRD